ncbi:MAG: serine hydrolase [Dysgonamonadaceae bacterium]|jgi:beta-glucosidase-like glycosyl hydrolase/CubicO group peptidase (beta-lactamase class C family)|nr:serine hydrolase [Dysgonamonadaceae bacterium]
MKKIAAIILYAGMMIPAYAQKLPYLYKTVDTVRMNHWVDSVCAKMTPDEKIGQLFMLVADPNTTPANTKKMHHHITSRHIGGILFSKGSVADQAASANQYQKTSRIPLLIALDGEWGLSMRLANTTRFPRNMMLGAIADENTMERYGAEVARQCKIMGIHLNFAPVLDVNSNPGNPVIGTRSFGENAQGVSRNGIAYSRGLESRGVMSVGKHFPGHGDTNEDSHETLPVVAHDRKTLEAEDLYPFRCYIDAGFSGIMTGHLSVPALDSVSHLPASLSPLIVRDLLQDTLGFKGLAFTDALAMKGAQTKDNICVQALLAGNDVLLSPLKPTEDFNAVKKAVADKIISLSDIEKRCRKILQYKYILGLNRYKPIDLNGLTRRLNSDSAEWICRRLNAEAITLLKNRENIVPLKSFDKNGIAVLSIGEKENNSFQQMLKKYTRVDAYAYSEKSNISDIEIIFKRLEKYDLIICGVHSAQSPEIAALRKLADRKKLVLCFFFSPYNIPSYRQTINDSEALVMAYENTDYAQEAAAQAIMGGIPMTGKLPVTIDGLFKEGEGITTGKTRLSYQSPLEVGMLPDTLRLIKQVVDDAIKERAFPGCQLLVAKNGVVVFHKTFGYFDYADTHPVETGDIYDLASVTKVMATLPAVMQLYDRKKIALSDRLSKYVKELKNTDKEDITIREALLHESGLAPFLPFYQLTIDKDSYNGNLFSSKRDNTFRILYDERMYARPDFKYLPDLVSKKPQKGFSLQVAEHFYLNDDFKSFIIRDIATSNLRKKNNYRYSDLNFMLLKEVVENITDTDLDEYLYKTYYRRLGADHTMFCPLKHKFDKENIAPTENDRVIRNQLLTGYVHDEAAAFMGGVSGNAGLFSNANDLAKLSQLYLNNGEYGGETYFKESTGRFFTTTTANNSRRGLGFDRPDPDKKPPCLPASTYGHLGFTGTSVWIDPDNQLIYILLSNRIYPNRANKKLMRLNIRSQIQEIIYRSLAK